MFFLLLLSCGLCRADTDARSLYDQGKYSDALELIRKTGLQNASDYYNAGNCYYKLGKLGQALAYFQKAESLAPGDDDIAFNLRLVTTATERQGSLPKNQSVWTGVAVPLLRRVPEAAIDILVALLGFAVALSANQARKRGARLRTVLLQPGFVILVFLWIVSLSLTGVTVMAHRARLAAVVADVGIGRSGPGDSFTELFTVPAGTTVELTGESREGWTQIRFSLGNLGWVMEKDLLNL